MKKINLVRFVSLEGILTTIAVIFQSAPVFLPAIGLALSPFSTLPIALAAYFNISLGITGLFGIVIGILYKKRVLVSILYSAFALTTGMLILTYLVGISAFGDFTGSLSALLTVLIYIIFSFVYAGIWNICLKRFIFFLINSKILY